jgi:2',3'-cyclic-nucleotide 2'-phosphodiesterase (5'-nucleotidase family)
VAWVKELKENRKDILVLDAGDLFFKKFSNPMPENEQKKVSEKAQLILESFNLMGVDALSIGDDDLTLGRDFLVELSKKARFPFLSSNIIVEDSGKLLFQPYLLKEAAGMKIGIFGLFSSGLFTGPNDPRKKGLVFRDPVETAQDMVKELQPKTDLIIVLSHLTYPKDIELAQNISGIHLIIGGHTGTNLFYPSLAKNTYLLQTAPKGMYGARIDFTFNNNTFSFYNSTEKRSLENRLNYVKYRLMAKETPGREKAQWLKSKQDTERALAQLQGKNEFTNVIFPLREGMKDDPDILKRIDEYKSKYPETEKTAPPK